MSRVAALVTGASRGVGRGIARALGSKGMAVYVTARDAETLAGTAREVTAAGGTGIAVVCDHADDAQVKALFERIDSEAGRLDLLVNNAAAVYPTEVMKPGGFWQKDLKLVDMITVGLRSDYVASYYAVPLMIKTGTSLIANISFYGAVNYFTGPAYGAAKAGTDKMTHDMAIDLKDTPVSIVSVWRARRSSAPTSAASTASAISTASSRATGATRWAGRTPTARRPVRCTPLDSRSAVALSDGLLLPLG